MYRIEETAMSITAAINKILDDADRIGVLEDGLQIADFTDETDEGNNLPIELQDGTVVSDDRELDEMHTALRARGWRSETDDSGVVIYERNPA